MGRTGCPLLPLSPPLSVTLQSFGGTTASIVDTVVQYIVVQVGPLPLLPSNQPPIRAKTKSMP